MIFPFVIKYSIENIHELYDTFSRTYTYANGRLVYSIYIYLKLLHYLCSLTYCQTSSF